MFSYPHLLVGAIKKCSPVSVTHLYKCPALSEKRFTIIDNIAGYFRRNTQQYYKTTLLLVKSMLTTASPAPSPQSADLSPQLPEGCVLHYTRG